MTNLLLFVMVNHKMTAVGIPNVSLNQRDLV